jgi:nitroimidazol reductase NimA-like FMN-containing flavoprotein (pyridoxamine 5'-phosphate oxidase superfamily)
MTGEPDVTTDWSGLEIMTTEECWDRLHHARVGHLGFVEGGEMSVLPVNIAVDGRTVVFRTGPGSKLSNAVMQQPVCVEVDHWDDFSHTGWSVLARGVATTVDDESEVRQLETLPVRPWVTPELRQRWVRIIVDEVSGRRILRARG